MATLILQAIVLTIFFVVLLSDVAYFLLHILICLFDFNARKVGSLYVPSKQKLVREMVRIAGPLSGKTIIDLGSGDGRLLISFVKAGAKRGIGYEINPALVWYSRLRVQLAGKSNQIQIVRRNYWQENMRQADIVVVFAVPRLMAGLEKKLRKELMKSSLVVSNELPFSTWKIVKQTNKIFLYKQQ